MKSTKTGSCMKLLICLTLLLSSWGYAADVVEIQGAEAQLIDIDLSSFCKDVKDDVDTTIEAIELSQKNTCDKIKELEAAHIDPITLDKSDNDGNKWKIRFSFGFSRTHYYPTDLHIKSTALNVVIKDVEMFERTSATAYDPTTWKNFGQAFMWIDEPTNTFTLSLEKKNNVFYLTIFHPKYLKSLIYNKTEVNGETQYSYSPVDETGDLAAQTPKGSELLHLGNTYHDVIWQIGYGRQFVLFNSKKAGKLSYTLRADIGINTGHANSQHITTEGVVEDYNEGDRYQGFNASLGQRLEYQRGRVSLFIDQKTIYSKVKHGFYDGTIDYNLIETPTTFGIGIDLFSKKRRR